MNSKNKTHYDVISLDSNIILNAVGVNDSLESDLWYGWIMNNASKIILVKTAKKEIRRNMKFSSDNMHEKRNQIYKKITFVDPSCIPEKQQVKKIFETVRDEAGEKGRKWIEKKRKSIQKEIIKDMDEFIIRLKEDPISESTQIDIEKALKFLCEKISEDEYLISSALALARRGKSTAFVTLDSEIILFKYDIEKLENGSKLRIIDGYIDELPN